MQVIWKGAHGNKPRREIAIGRGILLQKYYSIRRKLRKCGVLRKQSITQHTAEESVESGNIHIITWCYIALTLYYNIDVV